MEKTPLKTAVFVIETAITDLIRLELTEDFPIVQTYVNDSISKLTTCQNFLQEKINRIEREKINQIKTLPQ